MARALIAPSKWAARPATGRQHHCREGQHPDRPSRVGAGGRGPGADEDCVVWIKPGSETERLRLIAALTELQLGSALSDPETAERDAVLRRKARERELREQVKRTAG